MMPNEAYFRYSAGKSYREACKLIYIGREQVGKQAGSNFAPMHMLVGFSLELTLKAFLLQAGVPSSKVRSYGHRITELFVRSQELGLPLIPRLDQIIEIFDQPHNDFSYRYWEDGQEFVVANWVEVFPILDQLDEVVDDFVGASAFHGLTPKRLA